MFQYVYTCARLCLLMPRCTRQCESLFYATFYLGAGEKKRKEQRRLRTEFRSKMKEAKRNQSQLRRSFVARRVETPFEKWNCTTREIWFQKVTLIFLAFLFCFFVYLPDIRESNINMGPQENVGTIANRGRRMEAVYFHFRVTVHFHFARSGLRTRGPGRYHMQNKA